MAESSAQKSPPKNLYDQMGGHEGIDRLVGQFYALMSELPEAAPIRRMHPEDLQPSQEKLVAFLSGWSGGPPLYQMKHGNPMLRYRHLPFWIGDSERDQWMLCMRLALQKMPWPEVLKQELESAFQRVADHMRNEEQKMQSQDKKLRMIKRSNGSHWVGDGFPVRNIFSYDDIAEEISPFLLLDYAGPAEFPPSKKPRGVGEHPHRGFETVSIVYHGEVSHRDSSGGGGTIGPGEVQWMTAASGVVHEEFHGPNYSRTGGPFQMVQLWVNLPRKDKMTSPRYQAITAAQIPSVELPGQAGQVRVIAGECLGARGPALTFSPMNVWDVRLAARSRSGWEFAEGHTVAVLVLEGRIRIPASTAEAVTQELAEAELAVFEKQGSRFLIESMDDSKLLFLTGEPLNDPIVGYGPFVMCTEEEIRQAFRDYQSGRMGRL